MNGWTYTEFEEKVVNALENENRQFVHLDVEYSNRDNMNQIKDWALKRGYKAEEINCDVIKISR